jgi:hypothetical protein
LGECLTNIVTRTLLIDHGQLKGGNPVRASDRDTLATWVRGINENDIGH